MTRGLSVSDRTLHTLLTNDNFDLDDMSSSTSLNRSVASRFARNTQGGKDYRGNPCEHKVILRVNKTVSKHTPIIHPDLTGNTDEAEIILNRKAKFKVSKREMAWDGETIILHLGEV